MEIFKLLGTNVGRFKRLTLVKLENVI